jgi:hypothetical protein
VEGPDEGHAEIPLEAGAQGVLLTASTDVTTRRSGDGRRPIDNCTDFFDVGVYQVSAASSGSRPAKPRSVTSHAQVLDAEELTILTSWAEGIAEAVACAPEHVEAALVDADLARRGGPARDRGAIAAAERGAQLRRTGSSSRYYLTRRSAVGRAARRDRRN